MTDSIVKVRQYLLSGVSFAIPFIACGGILIAAGIAINSRYAPGALSAAGAVTRRFCHDPRWQRNKNVQPQMHTDSSHR